nr:hypothetical protein HmN_000309800 [Hymenolepis microstoma]
MVGNKKFREEYEKSKAVLDTLPFSRLKICAEKAHSFSFTFLAPNETYLCDVKIPTNYPDCSITWSFTMNGEPEERYNRLYSGTDCRDMPFTAQFQQIVIDMYTFCHHDVPEEYTKIDPEFADHYLKLISPIKTKIDNLMHKHLKPEKESEQELTQWTNMFLEFMIRNFPPSRKKNPEEVITVFNELGKQLLEDYKYYLKEEIAKREQEEKMKDDSPKPSSSKPRSPAAAASASDTTDSETVKGEENIEEDVSNPN